MMQTNFITLRKIYSGTSQNVQDFYILGTRVGKQKQVLHKHSFTKALAMKEKTPDYWQITGRFWWGRLVFRCCFSRYLSLLPVHQKSQLDHSRLLGC